MKILTITDNFPPESVGGSGQVAFDLSTGLKNAGHEVMVIAATIGQSSAGNESGIAVHRLHSTIPSKFWRSYRVVRHGAMKDKLMDLVSVYQPEVIHFHNVNEHFSYASMAWAAQAAPHAKIFFTAHDPLSFAYTRLYHFIDPRNPECRTDYNYKVSWQFLLNENKRAFNPFRNLFIRHFLKTYVHTIFCVSGALAQAFKQNGISHVMTLYNGVPEEHYQATKEEVDSWKAVHHLHDKKVIFFGGRAISDKGAEQLLQAMPEIASAVPQAVLVMAIEENSYAQRLRKITEVSSVSSNIMIIGLQHGRDLAASFNAADVVAVPSIYFDPAPLMNLQAMAAGKPVVGTCFGGTPEIVEDGVTGYIVNPHNIKQLAARLAEFLLDEHKAAQFGAEGLRRLKQLFTLHHQAEATLRAYRQG